MTKRVSIHYTRIFYYYFNCDYSIHFFKSSDEFQPILIQIWSFSRLYGLLDHRSHGMTHALCMLPIARGHSCSLIVASLGFSRSPFTIFIEDKFWECYLLFTWYLIYLHVMKSAHPCHATAIRIHNIVSNSICVSIFVWKTIEESILWTIFSGCSLCRCLSTCLEPESSHNMIKETADQHHLMCHLTTPSML